MDLHSRNGNGGAVLLPPTPRTIGGRGLARRKLDQRQKACMVADVLAGVTVLTPSQKQLADIFGVSVIYVMAARKLSPEKRAAILRGEDSTIFAALAHPARQLQLALPAPMCASVTNLQLEHVIRTVGVERVLEAAVAVERFDETLAPAL
jgi:hypothetical protein